MSNCCPSKHISCEECKETQSKDKGPKEVDWVRKALDSEPHPFEEGPEVSPSEEYTVYWNGIPMEVSTEEMSEAIDAAQDKVDSGYKEDWLNKTFDPEVEVIETNANGGKNSKIDTRYDLIPPKVLRLLARVLAEGAEKYAPNNWKLVEPDDHDNHAMRHRTEYLLDPTLEHLGHYLTRVVMFISQELDDLDTIKELEGG